MPREELARRCGKTLGGPIKAFNCGPKKTKTIGIITGAAGSEIDKVSEEKIDTLITGEAPHWAAVAAEELEMNFLLGGHYATETFGVKALAAHLSKRWNIPYCVHQLPDGNVTQCPARPMSIRRCDARCREPEAAILITGRG